MAKKPTTRDMSDKHEVFLAELFEGKRTKGSGNQFNDQMDGRNESTTPHPLAWDGKATFSKSISVAQDMWFKAVDQSPGLTPVLALRWYADDYTLSPIRDLVVLDAHDFAEILADARQHREGMRDARAEGF